MSRRKKKKTKVMKVQDPNTSIDSHYALKRHRAKICVFTANSPFNQEQQIINQQLQPIEDLRLANEHIASAPNVIDRMIEENRGVSDERLIQPKLKVDESREEVIQSN